MIILTLKKFLSVNSVFPASVDLEVDLMQFNHYDGGLRGLISTKPYKGNAYLTIEKPLC